MSQLPPPLPKPTLDYGTRPPSQYAPCPNCGQYGAQAVNFTWWGGVLGPKMFTHVKCPHCRSTYNGKTGKPNTTAIIIYTAVGAAIGVAVMILFLMYKIF